MTFEAINSILNIPDALARREVVRPDGRSFGIGWSSAVIRSFEKSIPQPLSINYAAQVLLSGEWRNCEVEVRRDGTFAIHLCH